MKDQLRIPQLPIPENLIVQIERTTEEYVGVGNWRLAPISGRARRPTAMVKAPLKWSVEHGGALKTELSVFRAKLQFVVTTVPVDGVPTIVAAAPQGSEGDTKDDQNEGENDCRLAFHKPVQG